MDVKTLIDIGDLDGLQMLLQSDPTVVNGDILWGPGGKNRARPLHYVCDKVFDGTLAPESAVAMARALIDAGADIEHGDGDALNAAASLHATEVGLLLLDSGARPDGRGLGGETPLHWAAHEGDVTLVQRLLQKGAPLEVRDNQWHSTPLGWALHGWSEAAPDRADRYRAIVARLVRAGAGVDPKWLEDAAAGERGDLLRALQGEPDAYTIRRATAADLETLVAFTLQAAREAEQSATTEAAVRRGIEGAFADPPRATYWVAEAVDGRVVGSTSVVTEWSDFHGGEYWWVHSVFIVPEHRGRGLVDTLLNHIVERAGREGALDVRLYAHNSNERAMRAYTRCGFTMAPYVIMRRAPVR